MEPFYHLAGTICHSSLLLPTKEKTSIPIFHPPKRTHSCICHSFRKNGKIYLHEFSPSLISCIDGAGKELHTNIINTSAQEDKPSHIPHSPHTLDITCHRSACKNYFKFVLPSGSSPRLSEIYLLLNSCQNQSFSLSGIQK